MSIEEVQPTGILGSGAIFGDDTRVPVEPGGSPPYKWICKVFGDFGDQWTRGTGFLLNMPNSTPVIVTSAHIVCVKGFGTARRLGIQFEGEANITWLSPSDWWAHPEYVNNPPEEGALRSEYDIAVAKPTLQAHLDRGGFGWYCAPNEVLQNLNVSVCGYPLVNGLHSPQQWISGGQVAGLTGLDQRCIDYPIPTQPGQSGSPLWAWINGYWAVVGVHSGAQAGMSTNRAFRLSIEAMHYIRVLNRYPTAYKIRSTTNSNAVLRMTIRPDTVSSDDVNCQYDPGGSAQYEDIFFDIVPVAWPPSTARTSTYPFLQGKVPHVICATNGPKWSVNMQEYGGTTKSDWGGVVTRQWGVAGLAESFILNKVNNAYWTFQWVPVSQYDPNTKLYLRMDGTPVGRYYPDGSGYVNWQRGTNGIYNRFTIEPPFTLPS